MDAAVGWEAIETRRGMLRFARQSASRLPLTMIARQALPGWASGLNIERCVKKGSGSGALSGRDRAAARRERGAVNDRAMGVEPAARYARERSRDRELLTRVAHGDVNALRELYDQHAPRAMAIAFRILRRAEEAEDIVQETFLEVWRRASQFDPGRGGAVAWVVTIARSRAIDRLRATATVDRTMEGASTAPDLLMPVEFPSPGLEVERRRDQVRVADALSTLPAEQRKTIELAYFEGLSQSEIATRTSSPLGTVKMRVKLALAKLSALLREEET
jgi:RNA polymerase sigma-70 factor (ECF subfamily)